MHFRLPKRWFLLLISAIFFSVSFEPSPFWFLAYFFVPTFIAALRELTFKEGFKSGYIFGFVVSFLTLYWVVYVDAVGVVLLIILHSLYYAVVGGLLAISTRRYRTRGIVLFPFVWIGIEYLRSLTQVSFPWTNLSYTQAANLPIVQLAELSGDATVSFFVLIVGILLYLGYRNVFNPLKGSLIFGVALAVYALAYIWGVSRLEPAPADFGVAALQGNIPVKQKWQAGSIDQSFQVYQDLSTEAMKDSVKLVIWPETAAPAYLTYEPNYVDWIARISKSLNIDILTGALQLVRSEDASKHFYNSAFFFTPEGMNRTPYNKQKLVPFGEHMPYAEKVGFIARFREFVKTKLGFDISDFEPGDSMVTFESHGKKFGTLICFEAAYPELVRQMVNTGVDFLTVITNDDWFGRTSGPYQHAAMPIFRAVESRLWIVRSANTGICEIVDPNGRIVSKTKLGGRTHLSGKIGDRRGETTFLKYGEVLSKICLAVATLAGLFFLFTKGRHV